MTNQNIIEQIIEQARWAPSGDNMQTWRFEIIDDHHFVIHGFDTRDHCVYDLQGHASQLAIGALMESISIAANELLYLADFKLREHTSETTPTIDVHLSPSQNIKPDPLFAFLPKRTVQRRMLNLKPLTQVQRQALMQSVEKSYTIKWIENLPNRWQAAWLMAKNAKLRLTLPEAYPTHSTIIEWDTQFSDDKIPDRAVGLDPIATKLMHWALKSWARVDFLNTYCFGTILPRIELDFLPGLFCAAHFALIAHNKPETLDDYLQAGRAIQRFWLTAAQLGLQLQPEMTPLIFSGYVRNNVPFTTVNKLNDLACQLEKDLSSLFGEQDSQQAVFLGRLGHGKPAKSRSLRLSVKELLRAA